MKRICVIFYSTLLLVLSCLTVLAQSGPVDVKAAALTTLPLSQIDIPIQISLKPLYTLAEQKVDTLFTSPQYPSGWVQADCATRYKYSFRRSPLRLSAKGSTLYMSFTGYYKIIGATRACVNGTVLSPWTPECKCGFDEGERKVEMGFASTFEVLPNHTLAIKLSRTAPKPLDKCQVCFWGQDITTTVMKGMAEEVDLALKTIMDSFGAIDLKPYMQQAWNKLNEAQHLPQLGYLSLQPKSIRMDRLNAKTDFLNLQLGIAANPAISFIKPAPVTGVVPPFTPSQGANGFDIHLEAALQYDSLSAVMKGFLEGKRFDIAEGFIKQYVIIRDCKVYPGMQNNLIIEVAFSGSHNGTVFFTGVPVYNEKEKKIEITGFDYDIKTKSFLLKTATWLFDKRIVSEIKKYTSIDLGAYYDTAAVTITEWLNKEWTKGIKGQGKVSEVKLTGIDPQPEHLLIRSNCKGQLSITVSEIDLSFGKSL